ncbi:beta-ketoacyl-ACP synthase III [Candidatus Leptofilum sp.]|uniref:beta-ketoacyl-ACP synthase III n=1 Tax=Candidatus Leptofilum sp. TaxID=3241576 RepID=UPI003B5A4591
MQKRYGRIIGWGAYVPEKVLTNHDLERMVDTSHEWIVQRTGIHQRHIAAPDETNATMSVEAARRALQKANLKATDLDLIIVATTTGDHITPAVSSQVQHMLGATNVPAFVLANGCTGFLYALTTAQQFINGGVYENILIIGSELLSRFIDWKDRSTCVLFGDAAGAFVMQASSEPCGLTGFDMGSDGSGSKHIMAQAMGSAEPVGASTFAEGRHYIRMNGREVFKFATRILGRTCQHSLAQAGLTLDDIDHIVPHQANLRIIQAAARGMGLPMSRFLVKVHKYGNTSAASIPVAICDGLDAGEISVEDRLLLVSFGSGLTWASAVLQMAPAKPQQVYSNGATAPAIAELVTA